MRWITRERPKIDRVACPWLIARFIDHSPEFHFAPPAEVADRAREAGAIPFDVAGVELSHEGERCSFDAFLTKYELRDPALAELATIVRGADTARLDLAPQCAGLLAISLGLSQLFADDHEQLRHGFVVYDALYAWLTRARAETHTWNPQRGAATASTATN
ncbi:MAG: chromate resistance protein ChrB domain-containing protein [Gemmatimonadaceae bacterium]